jgi:outer membrane protein OmpA-like peptidoglycan-associated protein
MKGLLSLNGRILLLSILCTAMPCWAGVNQSRTIHTTSDTNRASGFGLDIFVGIDGAYIQTQPIEDVESAKAGHLIGAKLSATLVSKDLEIEGGGAFYRTNLRGESDVVEGETPGSSVELKNIRITTDTAALTFASRMRLNEPSDEDAIWSIGPSASAMIGTNASFGPDTMKAYRSAIFLGAQLALSFNSKWKPRLVAEYLTDVNLHERQVHVGLLSLQFGRSFSTPKTIVRDIRTQTTDEVVKPIPVEKTIQQTFVQENVRILLDSETINFETDKATLLKRSETFLRELGRSLSQHPDRWTTLTIEGHTDHRGSLDYNIKLSLDRASAVRAALIRAGVPAPRINALGFGPKKPIDPRQTPLAWARNRRVELSFEGVKDPRWLREVIQKLKAALTPYSR